MEGDFVRTGGKARAEAEDADFLATDRRNLAAPKIGLL
jgi:hypothetical protein